MIKKLKLYYWVLFLGLTLLSMVGFWQWINQPKPNDPIVATVGSRVITMERFQQEMVLHGGFNPEKLNKTKLMEKIIERETLLNQAFLLKFDQNPEIIRAYHNLLIGKLKNQTLQPRLDSIDLTEKEIKEYYKKHPEKYTRPSRSRFALLFLSTHTDMSKEKQNRRFDRLKEARKKALKLPTSTQGFGQLAITHSEDQSSRYRGGDVGWYIQERPSRWESEVLNAGFKLTQIGQISNVVTTSKGYYLVKLLDRRPALLSPFKKVSAAIRHTLLLEQKKEMQRTFYQEIRDATVIKRYPEVVSTIPLSLSLPRTSSDPKMISPIP